MKILLKYYIPNYIKILHILYSNIAKLHLGNI